MWLQVLYSQHLIFSVTYKWAQLVRVLLHYTGLGGLARDKQSSLLDQFTSYEENKVIQMLLQVLYSQHLIFSVTYEWA
jgi:hypothetical protein